MRASHDLFGGVGFPMRLSKVVECQEEMPVSAAATGPERGSALVLRQVVVNRVGIALKIGSLAKAVGRGTAGR
ncbi:hypothetical protein R20943_02304 [Paraburkholderia aspalathi]|nr:hypothetical protein R20943_02304 [Paraburkholderia aspalathi]